jgi:uracil-DNA glycosylase family 4
VQKPAIPCSSCPLFGSGQGYVPRSGPGRNGVLLVGEAGGETEAREGKPFVGQAGWMLRKLLAKTSLNYDECAVHNCLSCKPPGNFLVGASYEAGALATCRIHLEATLAAVRPRVIVALGRTALAWFTGHTEILRYRGFVLDWRDTPLIATLHPSFLLPRRQEEQESGVDDPIRYFGLVVSDLRRAARIAHSGYVRRPVTYLLDPPLAEVEAFVQVVQAAPDQALSVDIETPYKLETKDEVELEEDIDSRAREDPIVRIGFSLGPCTAISLAWEPWYLDAIKALCASPNPKVTWNGWAFDEPRLAAAGTPLGGVVHDLMWLWHVYRPRLPRGLESVASCFADHLQPWKHQSHEAPAWYNAVDDDATETIWDALVPLVREAGLWPIYERLYAGIDPILRAVGQSHGVRIDEIARAELERTITQEIEQIEVGAQGTILDELKPHQVYKRPPDEPHQVVMGSGVVKVCSGCGARGVTKTAHCKGACRKASIALEAGEVPTYVVTRPFNLNSAAQLMAYAKHFHHAVGRNKDTNAEAMGKEHVAGLAKRYGMKHPIYPAALGVRKLSKALGTYVRNLAGGRVFTEFTHAPWTGRLSSRNINLQNISHRGTAAYAKEIRRCFVPPPGWVFVEADSAAIEAVIAGYLMKSPRFIDLAKRGIHAYMACRELGWPFDPDHARQAKREHKARYDMWKQVVYGCLNAVSARTLQQLYPEAFPKVAVAQEAQDAFYAECPEIRAYHSRVLTQAYHQGQVSNPWGYTVQFYEVFLKERDGGVKWGRDAKKVSGFGWQGSAGMFMRENIKLIWEGAREFGLPMADVVPAIFVVHDSYCLALPEAKAQEGVDLLTSVLTRPIPQMEGLRIGCEVSVGPNWGDMEVVSVVVP